MQNPSLLAEVSRPTRSELAAARKAMAARPHGCGCFGQVSMNPFYSGIVGHWHTYHPNAMAMLHEAQYVVLSEFAAAWAASREAPTRMALVPQPIKIG
jgi:hypothetical protein